MREGFRRRRLAGTALIVAILLALALPGVALAGQTRQGSVSGPFVALGDSFAAGNLIPASPSGTPAGCLPSSHDYGADPPPPLRPPPPPPPPSTAAPTTNTPKPP